MEKSILKNNIKKATIELLLLKLLDEDDKYGYQMVQELKSRSGGAYTVLEGSMYPILYRLEEQGFISSEERRTGKRMTRIYYHLETEGRARFLQLKQEFEEYVGLIHFLMVSEEGVQYEETSES